MRFLVDNALSPRVADLIDGPDQGRIELTERA
jgi:hypothetical protein